MAEDEGQEERIIPRIEKDDSRLFIGIGAVFTFLWIAFFLVLYSQTELPDDWSLNHLGDFLAGVFAPLAVFWFVLGFFLQIKEIRYQRIEINRLGGFTERQAHATEKQVAIGERGLEKGKEVIRPRLLFMQTGTGSSQHSAKFTINFKNLGGTAYDFNITTTSANLAELKCPKLAVEKNGSSAIQFAIGSTDHLPQPLEMTYLDLEKNEYLHKGLVSKDEETNNKFFDEQKLIEKKQR